MFEDKKSDSNRIVNDLYYMSNNIYLEDKRTVLNIMDNDVDNIKLIVGFILYLFIFVLLIPYLLIKYKYFNILTAYFPNLDMVATILGYHGGPKNTFIWEHLYNPLTYTLQGYVTSNIINFIALLGVTYIIAYYTYINKNMYVGWSRAFIMLPLTYFIPGNIIILLMNRIGKLFNNFFNSNTLIHYILTIIVGFILLLLVILLESFSIEKMLPYIINIVRKLHLYFKTI
jgi:hypothetical protein